MDARLRTIFPAYGYTVSANPTACAGQTLSALLALGERCALSKPGRILTGVGLSSSWRVVITFLFTNVGPEGEVNQGATMPNVWQWLPFVWAQAESISPIQTAADARRFLSLSLYVNPGGPSKGALRCGQRHAPHCASLFVFVRMHVISWWTRLSSNTIKTSQKRGQNFEKKGERGRAD